MTAHHSAARATHAAPEHAAPRTHSPPVRPAKGADSLIKFVIRQKFAREREYQHGTHSIGPGRPEDDNLVDFLLLAADQPHAPEETFNRLRWGGTMVYISRDWKQIVRAVDQYAEWRGGGAWALERRPITLQKYPLGIKFLGVHRRVYYFTARKVMLVGPGLSSDRFTYNVYLQKSADTPEYEVVKEVPAMERVLGRLKEKFPEADLETLKRRARKFTEKIFPVFLTREAAILKLLQRDLPKEFRDRVPRVIEADQDPQGYVRKLKMNWLRNGGKPITQLEFAHQATELLTALHDEAKVMHLDLRLDNFVITENGVGFVDFGSAVRVGEAFPEASLLSNLFDEMMRTSQIQRMLGKMTESGQVTSEEIVNCYHRIDKAVDFFYLAVQINAPHHNPDFRGLVKFDPRSREAKELAALTEDILRPVDAHDPQFTSARDILAGIQQIQKKQR